MEFIGYIILGFVLLICLKIYHEFDYFQLKCIISNVDGNTYCVRETAKLQLAADLLARVTDRCKRLVKYVEEKDPTNPDVERLVKNFTPTKISETLPTSTLTAYSENKGSKIAFCLNTKKNGTKMIDIETLTFVAIHELAHCMTSSIGHKPEFWSNMKYLLIRAKECGIYTPVDYKKEPREYCGMTISDNPFFDY
jgi:hypothetical protein|tara:strand:- start:294 stop:878 length:585 start_codon:yes stop_codon:yes gene_type:complete